MKVGKMSDVKASNREEILFCDNHILVANKPADLLTQPNESGEESLEERLKLWVKKEFKKSGNVFLHCLHRIDRVVRGIVLFARTSKALSRLNQQMREGKIERMYSAEIEGILKEEKGILRHFLIHGDKKALIANAQHANAKEAILSFQVTGRKKTNTQLLIVLKTGRYHQIRAQLSAIGHPIIGDTKYGAKPSHSPGIALCSSHIRFHHPVTQEEMSFEVEYSASS